MDYKIQKTDTFDSWLKGIKDTQAKQAVLIRIQRARSGNFGDVKSVGGGVSELRIFVGKGYRIYFTIRGQQVILLLAGSHKGDQRSAIVLAKKLAKELK